MQTDNDAALLSLEKAEWYRVLGQLQTDSQALTVQPLLVPLSIKVGKELVEKAMQRQPLLEKFAIQLKEKADR